MTAVGDTMSALMLTAIRELKLVDVPMPVVIDTNDILLKVKSVGVCGSDLHGYTGQSGRRTPPLIMGHEATAEVIATGSSVKEISTGNRVAIQPVRFCNHCSQCGAGQRNLCKNRKLMGMSAPGAYAPYVVWPAENLFVLPDSLGYEEGALAEPLSVAIRAVSMAHIKPYDTAFVAGAGPIGLLTLAVLKRTGVRRIAICDISPERLEIAKSIGAEITINAAQGKVREVVDDFTSGNGVDIAFEAVGLAATAQQTLEVTRNNGTIVWIGNNQRTIEIDMQAIVTRELRVLGSYGMCNPDFERALIMLAEDGNELKDQLINRRARLDEGPQLFEELLKSPDAIKCVINFP